MNLSQISKKHLLSLHKQTEPITDTRHRLCPHYIKQKHIQVSYFMLLRPQTETTILTPKATIRCLCDIGNHVHIVFV